MSGSLPPAILLSNDDGYMSEGLRALAAAMLGLGEVFVVAPESEQSAASHAISILRPLRIRRVRERWFAVDGTPTDCSYVGINHVLKERKPALMLSGINHGANLADDVTYSGTVAAAMEASLLGVPAIAVSLVGGALGAGLSHPKDRGPDRELDFEPAARVARSLATAALTRPLPPGTLLNVNVPGGIEPRGYAITRMGKHSYGNDVVEKVDPRGRPYYWIGGNEYSHEDVPGSDCNAVFREGLVSITPLMLDLTDDGMRERLRGWTLDGLIRFDLPPAFTG